MEINCVGKEPWTTNVRQGDVCMQLWPLGKAGNMTSWRQLSWEGATTMKILTLSGTYVYSLGQHRKGFRCIQGWEGCFGAAIECYVRSTNYIYWWVKGNQSQQQKLVSWLMSILQVSSLESKLKMVVKNQRSQLVDRGSALHVARWIT